ncbi:MULTISPECIES: hypothetical protein [unclassified Nocardia]|uniref:hypothetical protein n=1 Tax=unclassified Nocardia TaxID=2637762 RepID=UPI00342B4767
MKNQIPIQVGEGNIQNNFWSERRRWLVAIGVAILIVVSVSASVTIYLLQPDRAVSEQRAIEADREGRDNATPPARAEGVSGPPGVPGSLASSRIIELDGVRPDKATMQRLVPDGVALGQSVIDPRNPMNSLEGFGEGSIYFKLTGQNFTPVQISSIAARIVERRRPPAGTIVPFYSQGVTEALTMGFDLNSGDVVEAKALDGFGQFTDSDYMKTHAVTLALNETLAFKIEIRAHDCDCEFVVDIGFGDGRSLAVDDQGKPFRFVTLTGSYERAYVPMYDLENGSMARDAKLRLCDYPKECKLRYAQMYTK